MDLEYAYKMIELQENLPIRLVMHRRRSYSYHWHKELEVFLVLQGSVVIDTTKTRYVLQEGDILIMNCNEIHASHCPGYDDAILIVQMDLAFLKAFGYDFSQIIVQRDKWIEPGTVGRMKNELASIVLEMCKKDKGYQAQVMSHLYQFISDLLRRIPHRTRAEATETMSAVDFNRLNRIIAYVNDNYQSPISLKDVAKEEFLSSYYLSHFFKDKVGLTFSDFLSRIRLQKAVELLLSETSSTITELALGVGFPNVKAFNRCFKNKYQMSPFRYKKMIMGNEAGTDEAGSILENENEQMQQHQDLYSAFILEKLKRILSP